MRFKIDENLLVEIAELLRQHQHEALTVLDQQLGGKPDPDGGVAGVAKRNPGAGPTGSRPQRAAWGFRGRLPGAMDRGRKIDLSHPTAPAHRCCDRRLVAQ